MRLRVTAGQLAVVALVVIAESVALGAAVGHWTTVCLAGAGCCVLGAAAALVATGRVLRPMSSMSAAVEQITSDGVERLAEHCGPPELRHLIERVNELATVAQGQRLFVANVSHQLRTELHLLTMRLNQLDEYLSEAGADTRALAVADAERLHSTLTEHLEFARLIDASPPVQVDLGAVVATPSPPPS